jgi:hypothetical protein
LIELWLVKVGSRSGGLVFAGRYAEAGVTPTNTVSSIAQQQPFQPITQYFS